MRVYRASPAVRLALLPLVALLAAAPARGWTPEMQRVIAEEGAHLAPPDLARQIERHRAAYHQGVQAPFAGADPGRHVKNPDGRGDLDRVILVEAGAAVEAIRSYRPFSEVVFRLGVVAHYVADANDPLAASDEDRQEAVYAADYPRYVERVEPRLPLIFYGLAPDLDRQSSLAPVVSDALGRSRVFYRSLGREYRRIGFTSGLGGFDDRSTAFGVAAVSFSQAVTDVVQALRHIWVQAGGADPRRGLPEKGERLLLLPRSRDDTETAPRRGR